MNKRRPQITEEILDIKQDIVPDEKMVAVAYSIIDNLSKNNQNFLLVALKKLHNEDIARISTSEHRRIDMTELNVQLNDNAALIKAIDNTYKDNDGKEKK